MEANEITVTCKLVKKEEAFLVFRTKRLETNLTVEKDMVEEPKDLSKLKEGETYQVSIERFIYSLNTPQRYDAPPEVSQFFVVKIKPKKEEESESNIDKNRRKTI